MNLQPELEDELVFLRPVKVGDFDDLYEVAKDPLIWEQHPSSNRFQIDKFEAFFEESLDSKGALVIIEKSTGSIIGSSRYKRIKNSNNAIEIGWTFLSRDKWGGLYNRSVKTLMIHYAFQFFDNVIFYIAKTNFRSQKAVLKLGGLLVVDPKFDDLLKDGNVDFTFIIEKRNWHLRGH